MPTTHQSLQGRLLFYHLDILIEILPFNNWPLTSFTEQVFEFLSELIFNLSARFVLFWKTPNRQLASTWRIHTHVLVLLSHCSKFRFAAYSLNPIKTSSLSKSVRHTNNFDVLQNVTASMSSVSIYLVGIIFPAEVFNRQILPARLWIYMQTKLDKRPRGNFPFLEVGSPIGKVINRIMLYFNISFQISINYTHHLNEAPTVVYQLAF